MRYQWLPIIISLFLCLFPKPVLAAKTGSINVYMPENMAGNVVNYMKEGEEEKQVYVNEDGGVKIENLTEGVYQIQIPETEEYLFSNIRVSIPTWSEEEKKMLYDVDVYPKYEKKEHPVPRVEEVAPQTSDINGSELYGAIGAFSFILLLIMSCHNRFRCDTMTDKYSINGGQNNGNDNDTENPSSTRRIGLSSPGAIDRGKVRCSHGK